MDYEDDDFYGSEGTISDCCDMSEDNNDNDDDVGEFEYSEGNKEEKNSIILSEADMRQRQAALIDTVSSVLSIPKADASIVLRHYRWNLNRVEEAWFSDEDKVRNSFGLVCNGPVVDPPVDKNITCGICYEKKRVDRFRSTGCGHMFCVSCWKRYVNMAIRDGPGCLKLRCPAPKCHIAVNQDMIYKLVYKFKQKEKYDRFLLGSYVEGSEKIKWCPGPGCENAVEFDAGGEGIKDVFCSCRYGFCWNCTQDAHRPVDCDTVDKWMKKNEAESENTNWILAYTKPCPQCKRTIEKNEGCMHMTCGEPCKFEFCWLCLGAWVDHKSFYECNKFDKEKKEGKVTDEDRRRDAARVIVERYTHYYERWNANDLSRKKAIQELRKIETESLEELSQKLNKPIAQLEFIAEAWVQIIECRRVLKWTYAYGYYMPEDEEAKKRLFEYLQGQAEAGLERLHHCTEMELGGYLKGDENANDFYSFRMKLKGLTSVTGTFFDNLVKALENGLADVDSHGTEKVTALEEPINA